MTVFVLKTSLTSERATKVSVSGGRVCDSLVTEIPLTVVGLFASFLQIYNIHLFAQRDFSLLRVCVVLKKQAGLTFVVM